MSDNFDWVDKEEERMKDERSKDYFNIQEGKQQFVLLSHLAPLTQVFDNKTKKYRVAEEGDRNVSIKGVGWVLQDGVIKQAKLPYTIVKAIKALREDPDWSFTLPFPHTFTLTAKNAGSKEVEYNLTTSPKAVEIPKAILDELAKKPTPEDMVERIKGKKVSQGNDDEEERKPDAEAGDTGIKYPEEDIKPEDIPF